MKKQIVAVMLLMTVGIAKIYAQNFIGYRSGNYTGVNGVFFNPASIADSRYRLDINLFSASGFIGNNKADFKLKDIGSYNSTNFKNNFLNGSGNTNANINAEILGPSVMFKLTRKSAMAITTRARVVSNLKDFDGNLINSVLNTDNANFPYTINSNSNSRLTTNAWTEIGLSYAREIASNGPHFFKGGITLKYLSGAVNNYLQINKINTTITADMVLMRPYFNNTAGSINIGTTTADYKNVNINRFFNGNIGLGGDIGFVYEYRPAYLKAGAGDKNSDKYKLRVGLSLLDIGSIQYSALASSSAAYTAHITGNNRFYLDQVYKKNNAEIKAVLDANPQFFTNTSAASNSYNASLPTVVQGDVDYHLNKGLYLSLSGQLSMVDKNSLYSASQSNNLTLTPRYEAKHFGIYFPLNYNELTQFNAGISLRAGPIFIGSGSLFTAIVKSKQVDMHIGLRVGFLPKIKKSAPGAVKNPLVVNALIADKDGDGIIDVEDKCPDIAGNAKYRGCPIPDTDGDGINDEEDKCPTVIGVAKYQGCPAPDTDGDGINDDEDKCPTIKGVVKYQGCPVPDTDGDGVNDDLDKCPTIAGPVNNFGCPEIKKATKDKINFAASKIFFDEGSRKLSDKSFQSLNGVVSFLKSTPSLKMDIDGYSDNTGNPVNNLALSQNRAAAVKDYLVSKGVAERNLLSTGHGIENPIAENKTAAGRSKNRRVELTVRNF